MEHSRVYKCSLEEAEAREETALFRESHKLDIACKIAIEDAIRKNFDGMHLKRECIGKVIEEYGPERVDWVLANTIQKLNHDGRFSYSNKKWAGSFAIPESSSHGCDLRLDFIVRSHPAVLDLFVELMRLEREAAKEQPQKPSIKKQLAAPPISGDKPVAKSKEREAGCPGL